MILEISQEQRAYQQTIAAFAGDACRPGGQCHRRRGHLPAGADPEAAALGLLGVTIPQAWGGAGRDYVDYAWRWRRSGGPARSSP